MLHLTPTACSALHNWAFRGNQKNVRYQGKKSISKGQSGVPKTINFFCPIVSSFWSIDRCWIDSPFLGQTFFQSIRLPVFNRTICQMWLILQVHLICRVRFMFRIHFIFRVRVIHIRFRLSYSIKWYIMLISSFVFIFQLQSIVRLQFVSHLKSFHLFKRAYLKSWECVDMRDADCRLKNAHIFAKWRSNSRAVHLTSDSKPVHSNRWKRTHVRCRLQPETCADSCKDALHIKDYTFSSSFQVHMFEILEEIRYVREADCIHHHWWKPTKRHYIFTLTKQNIQERLHFWKADCCVYSERIPARLHKTFMKCAERALSKCTSKRRWCAYPWNNTYQAHACEKSIQGSVILWEADWSLKSLNTLHIPLQNWKLPSHLQINRSWEH